LSSEPAEPQSYCINQNADFYPYTGKLCKAGYQLGPGNCRRPDGRVIAIEKKECLAISGNVELPYPATTPPPTPQPENIKPE